MALRVPFSLLRREEPAAIAGLLLESDDPEALLAACARLTDPLVFRVAGGFLIVADSVSLVPNSLRLRRLSENCYLPADADLVPALLPAEAVDLTARRGLVFLPNRSPLAFDPAQELNPAAFLSIAKPRREDWEPFPAGPTIAERLISITRLIPDPPLDELLSGGGPPIGADDARPPSSGAGRRAIGKMSAGLGKGLGAIGKAIGSKKLGDLGDKLKAKGAEIAPRINEDLLGRQEAALQHLLKKFRQGKTDDALRHAVPIGNEPGRGSRAYGSAQLPTHGLFWSLASLFGGGGRASIWAGGNPETWRDLIAEYHKAAREAAERGDFRRAALIYAKLLSDFRSAAAMLSKGGLHRESGILYRDKVRDRTRAAHEFAQAAEYDEALKLYRESHLYVEAGDLLRRMGEEELAIVEFHKAADRVVQMRQDHVEAGDILLQKTGRADLAGAYFARGWESRSQSLSLARNASGCAERLIEIYAFAEPRDPFWELLGQAEDWLNDPGWSHDAGRFFNKVAGLADLPHLRSERPEIRDRCRLGLANKLRQHAKVEQSAGTIASDLFGVEKRWSPAVVSDADFALRSSMKQRPKFAKPAPRPVGIVSLYSGTATAAIQAPGSTDLFVGFRDGTLVHYHPPSGRIKLLQEGCGQQVVGLAVDEDGTCVACLRFSGHNPNSPIQILLCPLDLLYRRLTDFEHRSRTHFGSSSERLVGLLPLIHGAVGVSTINGVTWFDMPALTLREEMGPTPLLPPTTYLKIRIAEANRPENTFTFEGGSVSWGGRKVYIGWMPDPAAGSTLFTPPVAWSVDSPSSVRLAGLFDNGHFYSSQIVRQLDGTVINRTRSFTVPSGFRAAAIWQTERVIGVSAANRVYWLRESGLGFEEWSPSTELVTPMPAVACFTSHRTRELLVVLEDGDLARVPIPI